MKSLILLSLILFFFNQNSLAKGKKLFKADQWLVCNEFDASEVKDFSLDCKQTKNKDYCVYKDVNCELKGSQPRSVGAEAYRDLALMAGSYEWMVEEIEGYYLAGFTYDIFCKKINGQCPRITDCMSEELSKYLDTPMSKDERRQRLRIEVKDKGERKSVN